MNALLLGEKTLKGSLSLPSPLPCPLTSRTGVICYKDNHKPAIESLASGKIVLDGSSPPSFVARASLIVVARLCHGQDCA